MGSAGLRDALGGHRFARAAFGLAAAALLIVAPACTREPEAEPERTPVRLVTWKANQPEVWERVYRDFARENPDLELIREVGPHSSTAFHDLLTQKLKNRSTDVDVFLMDVIWPPEFAAAGWAEPLDARFSEEDRRAFLSGAVLANTYEGKVYGVPLFVGSGLLYYRTDLLERYGYAPPKTWGELVAQARDIVAREGTAGREISGFSGQFKQYEGLVCDMMEYILGNGGHVLEPTTGRSAVAEPPAVEAVRFVRDRIVGGIAPRGVLTYQEPESLDVFLQGRAVFHRNWPYAWEVSNNPERSQVAGKVGIAPIPHFEGGESHATLGGWQIGVSRYSEHPDAAWRLVRFLTSAATQRRLAVEAGLAPTREALYEDPDVLAANPQFAHMSTAFLTARPRPRTPLYPAVSNVLQRYFSTALADPAADLEAQARAASREVDRILELGR